jgi:hypothetical protein
MERKLKAEGQMGRLRLVTPSYAKLRQVTPGDTFMELKIVLAYPKAADFAGQPGAISLPVSAW